LKCQRSEPRVDRDAGRLSSGRLAKRLIRHKDMTHAGTLARTEGQLLEKSLDRCTNGFVILRNGLKRHHWPKHPLNGGALVVVHGDVKQD
jgi:23S rRNA A2030 N6-methylase RlmJ